MGESAGKEPRRIYRGAGEAAPIKPVNPEAGCGVLILAATGVFPYGIAALVMLADGDSLGLVAFFAVYAVTHFICAAVMFIRYRAGTTAYSMGTLLLNALVIGSYAGGFFYLVTKATATGGVEGAEDVWQGALPATVFAAAMLWSVIRDSRASTPPSRSGTGAPPDDSPPASPPGA